LWPEKLQPAIINSYFKKRLFNLQKDIKYIKFQLQDALWQTNYGDDGLCNFTSVLMLKKLIRLCRAPNINLGECEKKIKNFLDLTNGGASNSLGKN